MWVGLVERRIKKDLYREILGYSEGMRGISYQLCKDF